VKQSLFDKINEKKGKLTDDELVDFFKRIDGLRKTAPSWLSADYVFMKNAGYDVMKLAGFKRPEAEVKGTPMEAFYSVVKGMPGLSKEEREVDADTLMRMSEVNLTDLNDAFLESRSNPDTSGLNFIHPKAFGSLFPIARVWPFDARTIGERGIGDYIGAPNVKLTANQKEYIKLGHELYKIAHVTRKAYEATLMKDHPLYKNVSYDDAIKRGGGLGKMRHFCWALTPYVPNFEKQLLSDWSKERAHKEIMDDIFAEHKEAGVDIHDELIAGHYAGYAKGYPVMFVRTTKSYRMYMKQDYGNPNAPGRNFVEIPLEKGQARDSAVDKALGRIDIRMAELLKGVKGTDGKEITAKNIRDFYKGGQWIIPITLPGSTEFKRIAPSAATAHVTVLETGEGVNIRTEGKFSITLDELAGQQYTAALALLAPLMSQKEFRALQVFANAGTLRIRNDDETDVKFTVILRNGLEIDVKDDGTKFTVDAKEMEELIKNPLFATAYVDSLMEDKTFEFTETTEKLKDLIENAPDKFWEQMWLSMTDQSMDTPSDSVLNAFSGSVQNYYTETVINVTIYQLMNRLRRGMGSLSTFEEVEKLQSKCLYDANAYLESIARIVSEESADKKWDRDGFITRVIDPIRLAGGSGEYTRIRTQFEFKVYDQVKGLFGGSDLSKSAHLKAAEIMKVYTYYTSHLDGMEYEYENPLTKGLPLVIKPPSTVPVPAAGPLKAKVDLDHLPTPPIQLWPTMDPKQDPGLRGWYILRYFDYVQTEMLARMRSKGTDVVPDGSATDFWRIMEFDKWLNESGIWKPLDPMDEMKPFEHKLHSLMTTPPRDTELDGELRQAYLDTVDLLVKELGPKVVNRGRLMDFLNANTGDPNTMGLFIPYTDSSLNRTCKLWQQSDDVEKMTGVYGKRRRVQINLISEKMDDFVSLVFEKEDPTDSSKLFFFDYRPTIINRTWWISRFPSLRRIL